MPISVVVGVALIVVVMGMPISVVVGVALIVVVMGITNPLIMRVALMMIVGMPVSIGVRVRTVTRRRVLGMGV